MRPDIVVAWPDNCDYPLWRKEIHDNRGKFENVIVVFTRTNKGRNYSDFVRDQMLDDGVTMIDSPMVMPGQDWRNVAVNAGLKHSRSEWIYFTEQDFYPTPLFYREMQKLAQDGFCCMAVYQGERMHPCAIVMDRPLLEMLDLNFGIVPGVSDHFSIIQNQIDRLDAPTAHFSEKNYYHYNGLSHNWALVCSGEPAVYHPQEFVDHLTACIQSGVVIDPEWRRIAERAITAHNALKTPLPSPLA